MFSAEELIRRLSPVIGGQADAFWNAYLVGDVEDRKLILRILENLHAGLIDDYRCEEIVLTPPGRLSGEYPVGTVWYAGRPLYPFAFQERELVQHAGVFGRTGAGKSYFVKGLLTAHLVRGKPVLVFDWKGTYGDLGILLCSPGSTSAPFCFNPLDLEGIDRQHRKTYHRQVIALLIDCYLEDLRLLTVQGVEYLLLQGIDHLCSRKDCLTFHDIYEWMRRYEGRMREMDWKTTAINILYKLTTGPLGKVVRSSVNVERLATQQIILELDNAGSASDKSFLIRSLLLRLYYHFQKLGPAASLRLLIVVEEAHNILLRRGRGHETIVELMLRQIREFGVGLCVVDQHPSLMSLPALGTYCTVSFNLRLRHDREAMASALSLEQTDYLGRLPPRFAIVKIQDRFLTPFLIKTFRVRKGATPPRQVVRDVRPDETVVLGCAKVIRADNRVIRAILQASNREEIYWEEAFLIHVYMYPLMGAVERYGQLGLSAYQGHKHRTSLIDKGLVVLESVPTSTGRIKLMAPTAKGFDWLKRRGFSTGSDKVGGIEHQYWKRRLRDRFKQEGFGVEVEFRLEHNSAVDLLVIMGKRRVGVEVETGSNAYRQIQTNIEKCLARYDGVVSFVLHPAKAVRLKEIFADRRVAVVSDECGCLNAVKEFTGDGS